MFKNLKIGARFAIGFCFIFLLLTSITFFGINRMGLLSTQTTLIYNHPLIVSNAVLRINANIIKMHRSMKDVVLAQDKDSIEEASEIVSMHEKNIFEDFKIIDKRFLGGKEKYKKAQEVFFAWKPIRDEVVSLMLEEKKIKAASITKGKGARHVLKIEKTMEAVGNFAAEKAKEFLHSSEIMKKKAFNIMYLLITISVLVASILSFFLTRSITIPINKIRIGTDKIGQGLLDTKIEVNTRDEVGNLAVSFNKMTADLKKITASRDELDMEITERKKAKNKLENLNKKLKIKKKEAERSAIEAKNANKTKSEFMANMSHELRTPLNGILGLADVLLHSVKEVRHHKKLQQIISSGEALLSLVNDILDLSRIEEGKLSLNKVNFNLRKLIERTSKQHTFFAQKKGLKFKFSINKDVPVHLLGDPLRLNQIITNLLGNAIKFTIKGEVFLVCGVWDDECGMEDNIEKQPEIRNLKSGMRMLHFSVRDTGIGIPKKNQAKIFSRFTQSDSSTTRQFGGSGLGTTISRELVEMMGGSIWLESEVDKGSVFHFTARFGIVQEMASVRSAPVKAKPLATVGPALSILLVEDNPVNQEVAKSALELLGHHVDLAQNGKEGVEKWEKGAFDLILMDIQMPEMDGFEATGIIRNLENNAQDYKNITGRPKLSSRIPILAMTAHAMAGDREKCLRAGMDEYISKPITLDRLRARITRITGDQTAGILSEKKEVKVEVM